jgi:hypothetical protein
MENNIFSDILDKLMVEKNQKVDISTKHKKKAQENGPKISNLPSIKSIYIFYLYFYYYFGSIFTEYIFYIEINYYSYISIKFTTFFINNLLFF